MTYENAVKLKIGNTVIIKETGKEQRIIGMDGHIAGLFLILEDGLTYHHKEIEGKEESNEI